MHIAVDFDGTIVKNRWPKIGRFRLGARTVLKWLYKKHDLILYTCREGLLLQEADLFLAQHKIVFKYANTNLGVRIRKYGSDCRKISADWYIDDKAGFIGWWSIPVIIMWLEWKSKILKEQ